jgi:hypothetical protein
MSKKQGLKTNVTKIIFLKLKLNQSSNFKS